MGKKYGLVLAVAGIIIVIAVFFAGAFIQENDWLKWTGVEAKDILVWCGIALVSFLIGVAVKKTGRQN